MIPFLTQVFLALILLTTTIQTPDGLSQADRLFAKRDDPEKLKQAVALAERLAANSASSYEALWRLSKYRYYVADREPDKVTREKLFHSGADAAKKAIAAEPNRVEGHFWLGANTGELASLKGALESLGLIRIIRREFEAALAIDPGYHEGAIYLALGEMDLQLPRLFGGNERRGIERLEDGLKGWSSNAELKLALADVYLRKNRPEDARRLLDSIVADNDPLRSPLEMQELRTKARQRIEKIR